MTGFLKTPLDRLNKGDPAPEPTPAAAPQPAPTPARPARAAPKLRDAAALLAKFDEQPQDQIDLSRSDLEALPPIEARRKIDLSHCSLLTKLPEGLTADALTLDGCAALEALPPVQVRHRITLANCPRLTRLPDGLTTGSLTLDNCTALERLPAGLRVTFLSLNGCSALAALPDDLKIDGGRLSLRDCVMLTRLPNGLGAVSHLDVSGCPNLTSLPDDLQITSTIDVAGSGIASLPERFDHVGLRWRETPVSRRVVFAPETLTAKEVLQVRDAELRLITIERYGRDRFIKDVKGVEIESDLDGKGPRRSICFPSDSGDNVLWVGMIYLDTGRTTGLRAPSHMTSFRQAAAWVAGEDEPPQDNPTDKA